MTTCLRMATLLTAGSVLVVSAALADIPSGPNSTIPDVNLVGHDAGTADPTTFGVATFTIRDGANNPLPNMTVMLNLSACTDVSFCVIQPAGTTVDCAARTISGVTNAFGVVTFRIVGGGRTTGAPVTTGCASVTADGAALGTIKVSTFDINGVNGLTAADLTLAKNDLAVAPNRTRADFNKSGTVTAADLTIMKSVLNGGGSPASCANCPP